MSSGPSTRRRPTILEVARLAGVSHQTVSRYLRFEGEGMKPATRERIGEAIAQLEYRPNLLARAMRSRRTGRLALLLPTGNAISALEMLTGASAAAHEAGYVVELVTLSGDAGARLERVLELADSRLFEGVVSLNPLPPLPAGGTAVPVVVSPQYDDHMRGIGQLADASRMADILEKLAADGHRRFLHLGGDYAHTSARCRRQVYLETVERLHLDSYAVVDCDWSPDRARRAVLDLPEGCGVTAIIAANDLLAAGAVHAASARNWSVPGDVSITGWDNNPVAAVLPPTLTSVEVDHAGLGRRAVGHLLAALEGRAAPVDETPVTRVLWRDSTGPAPSATGTPGVRSDSR